ncbi:MAG: adenosine kinase [Cyclobacteriaceae bacterium]|nr:adenosine kinase [Cyclobacteriaceae bacterium]
MKKYNVYGIGNALVDIEFEVEEEFFKENEIEKGVMTLVDEERQTKMVKAIDGERIKKQGGGSAANTMIGVSQFGGSGFYSCKVANDDYGKFYMNDLTKAGLDTNLNQDKLEEGITGKCLVMVTPDADRTMNTFLGITATLDSSAINEEAIKNADYVYIEGYLITSDNGKEAMKQTKALAEKHGVKTSITLSDPAIVNFFKPSFEEVIGKGVDLLFCNENEAMQYTGTDNLLEAREKLKFIAKRFAITLGKNGAMIFDGDTFIDIESYKVDAIDSNGAGDMFAGAFLYGITNGHSYANAGKIASLAASKIVSKFGPRLEEGQAKEILTSVVVA